MPVNESMLERASAGVMARNDVDGACTRKIVVPGRAVQVVAAVVA